MAELAQLSPQDAIASFLAAVDAKDLVGREEYRGLQEFLAFMRTRFDGPRVQPPDGPACCPRAGQ